MKCTKCGEELSAPYRIKLHLGRSDTEGVPLWRRICLKCEALYMSPYETRGYVLSPLEE